MANMTTVLTEFSDKDNSRLYTVPTHTLAAPKYVHQKRKVPTGKQVTIEDTIHVQYGTNDADGVLMPQRVSFTVVVARPIGHTAADVTAALALFREIIASDNFTNVVDTQEYVQ